MAFARILTKPPNQCQWIWTPLNGHSFLDAVQVHPIFVMCSILKMEQVQYLSHFHFAQYLRQAHVVACQGPRNSIAQIGQYLGFIKQPHIWWAEFVKLTKFYQATNLINFQWYWKPMSVFILKHERQLNLFVVFLSTHLSSIGKLCQILLHKKDLLLMHCTSCKCDVKW